MWIWLLLTPIASFALVMALAALEQNLLTPWTDPAITPEGADRRALAGRA